MALGCLWLSTESHGHHRQYRHPGVSRPAFTECRPVVGNFFLQSRREFCRNVLAPHHGKSRLGKIRLTPDYFLILSNSSASGVFGNDLGRKIGSGVTGILRTLANVREAPSRNIFRAKRDPDS